MNKGNFLRYAGAGIVFIVLVIVFLDMQGYLGHRIDPGTTPLPPQDISGLKTIEVTEESVATFETAVGTLSSKKETVITAKVPAHIRTIHVKAGDRINANDLLIELDRRDIDARIGQAQSGLSAAKAAQTQAESAFKRYQNLRETGAATQAEFESVDAQFQMANAKVQEAQKGIEELTVMLGFTEIRAPYSGVIIEKLADVGTLAAPGVPLLKMGDTEMFRLEVFVPESRRSSLDIGKSLMVRMDSLGEEIPGRIDEIVPSSDPRSRSFLMRISLDPNPLLKPGMFGRCYLPLEDRKMLLIDPRAVYRVGQIEMVRVVANERVETRLVRTGFTHETGIEILSGLVSGERVVIHDEVTRSSQHGSDDRFVRSQQEG